MSVAASGSLKSFPNSFRGPVLYSGTDDFVKARAIFNTRMGHQEPTAIAKALDAADVITLVRYAADQQLPLAVRAGGHGVDGSAMPEGALVLDLTAFKSIAVDTSTSRVQLGAGTLLGEMDAALHEYGLVVPSGTVSTTGVAGLTIGGGVGYTMRRYGATVDNVIACEVVTTDGRLVRASQQDHADLFWALRGGGGNFGIVTALEFQARPMQPVVSAGMIPYIHEQAPAVLRALREYMPNAPRELAVIGALTPCPPLPPVPAEMHGKDVLMLVMVYTGPPEQAETVINELAACGTPVAIAVQPVPWPVANSMLDAIAPYGRRVYTKGGYLSELSDAAIEIGVKHAAMAPPPTAPPTPSTVQNFWSLGGAISEDFEEDSCAFSREGATWFWEVATQWDDEHDDLTFMRWADGLDAELRPHMRDNCYINLTTDMGPEWRSGAWGSPAKYGRLLEAKAKWDPDNMLRYNKNIDVKANTPRRSEGASESHL
jgi:hypothetical protein